jgi:hypothetical protein
VFLFDDAKVEVLRDLFKLEHVTNRGKFIGASCPFANFTHEGKLDLHPSFWISKSGSWGCCTCHESGRNLEELKSKLHIISEIPEDLIPVDRGEDSYKKFGTLAYEFEYDYDVVNGFAKAYDACMDVDIVTDYCMERGISKEIVSMFGLRFTDDFYGNGARVVFPIIMNNMIVGLSGRIIGNEDNARKYFHAIGFKKSRSLFGFDFAKNSGVVYVVEGFMDVLGLADRGFKAVAIMGDRISKYQAYLVSKLTSKVVCFMDGDKAGRDGSVYNCSVLKEHLRDVSYIAGNDKDPDEYSGKEIMDLTKGAVSCN